MTKAAPTRQAAPRHMAMARVTTAVLRPVHAVGRWWGRLRHKFSGSPHHSFRATPYLKKDRLFRAHAKEAWLLMTESATLIYKNRRFFIWMIIIYAVVTYILVGGVSQIDYASLKKQSSNLANGLDVVTTSLVYFGAALTGGLTEAPNPMQQFLSGLLILIFWLATIWSARMLLAGKKIKVRDAFYGGMTPIISTTLLFLVLTMQLIPAGLGLFSLSVGLTQYWITNIASGLAFGVAALLSCLLSLYWLSGSIVALAVVALPGTYPLRALDDARTLAMGKRWEIVLRIVVAAALQLLVWGAILVPTFALDRWLNLPWLPLVPIMIQLMGGFSTIFTSVYVYKLYRSLL
ncbi:MAG TPA: hypothetical protein VNG90_04820 [Candidatus Acidoferrum sp.]|nr:hypothetical protein [Candidatus Acidoferrum sp.]